MQKQVVALRPAVNGFCRKPGLSEQDAVDHALEVFLPAAAGEFGGTKLVRIGGQLDQVGLAAAYFGAEPAVHGGFGLLSRLFLRRA